MKQHITKEQVGELSGEGKERLKKWVLSKDSLTIWDNNIYTHKGHGFDSLEDYGYDLSNPAYKDVYPLLSIGQMIEFIAEKTEDISYIDGYFNHNIGSNYSYSSPCFAVGWGEDELCNYLWEACRGVLEK